MDDFSEDFIRLVLYLIRNRSPQDCQQVVRALNDGDRLTIQDMVPGAFR